MANYRMNKIAIGSNAYEVAEWYGTCSTAANIQGKFAIVTGFYSASLVEGVRVVVRFTDGQTYNGTPTLDVNGTGAKYIRVDGNTYAGLYEWKAGQIIAFVYYNGYWVIEDGGHGTTAYFGKTKLTNTISNNSTVALTPKAVYDAGYVNSAGAAAAAPVQSVNGQTGTVTLAIPTVPTDVSSFNNDAGYLTLSTLPIWDGSVT